MKNKSIFVSNLAWNKKDLPPIIDILKKNKVSGIDFAPLQITTNWHNIEKKVLKHNTYLKKNKIKINAIQGIFFKKKFNLFKQNTDLNKIITHLRIIFKLCTILNCKKIIVGSSEFRNNYNISKKNADFIFIKFLKKILPLLKKNKIFFCIETIPKQYNEKYLYNFDHTIDLIRRVNSQWVRINYDTSIFHYKKLNFLKFKKNIHLIKNIQITENKFNFFLNPNKKNVKFCKNICKINVIKQISLEIISKISNLNKLDLSIKNLNKLLT